MWLAKESNSVLPALIGANHRGEGGRWLLVNLYRLEEIFGD